MCLMIVAGVSICADTHCSVSISVHRHSRYTLLWDGCISLFFCIILLCIISCSNRNGSVDCTDGEGNDDSFIQSSLMCCHLSCKIRFEALKSWRGIEGNSKGAVKLFWLYIYWIILNGKVYYKSYSFCR